MSDSLLDDAAPSGGADASAAATATTLSTLGYGLFAWLQPHELEAIEPMRVISESVAAETGALAGAEVAPDAEWAARQPVPDVLFDEDLAAAEMLVGLGPTDVDPDPADVLAAAPAAHDGTVDEVPAAYSTPRDTIAMLEEIAFLDE